MKRKKEREKVRGSGKVGESVIVNVNREKKRRFFIILFLFLRTGRIKHILKKENRINLNQSYTKEQKSTKRERALTVLVFL